MAEERGNMGKQESTTETAKISQSAGDDCYAPFKPPFRYCNVGNCIYDNNNELIVDIRGWGYLTGKGSLGYTAQLAVSVQDKIGERIARFMSGDLGV